MTSRKAPPLWKAVVIYYAAMCFLFAFLGIVGADGSPAGAVAGLGILAVSHFAPLVPPPQIEPLWVLLLLGAVAALCCLALRLLSGWIRIGVVIGGLLTWLGWGFSVLGMAA